MATGPAGGCGNTDVELFRHSTVIEGASRVEFAAELRLSGESRSQLSVPSGAAMSQPAKAGRGSDRGMVTAAATAILSRCESKDLRSALPISPRTRNWRVASSC